ncbi:hypothetical protein ACO0R3_004056 [Hanseniaspora guilliermondii]
MKNDDQLNLPIIDPKYNIISSTEQLRNLSPFQYTEAYVFVGMIDSAQISKRGNLVVNLINPASIDVEYISDKKNKGMFCFLSSDLQRMALKEIERKFEWKPVANTMTYFKSGKLIPTVITCTVHSSNSVHPPFLMCKSIDILSYRSYAQIAANCNIEEIRNIVTDSFINIKKLNDDPKNIFSIIGSRNANDNVDLFRKFDNSILEEYKQQLLAQKLLNERAAEEKRISDQEKEKERLLAEEKAKQEKLIAEEKQTSKDLNTSLKIFSNNEKSNHNPSQTLESNTNLKQKQVVPLNDNVPLSMMTSQINSGAIDVQNKDVKEEPSAAKDDEISKQIENPSAIENEETGDNNFFEMDIPQFSTQVEQEQSQPILNKPKPKFVPVDDVEFISDSDESDYDMMTGKRKETSKTPSIYEPALKRKKENEAENDKSLFIAETHKENNPTSDLPDHESSSSGFLDKEHKNFYRDSVMDDVDKTNDIQEKSNQPINKGKEIISNFFGTFEGKKGKKSNVANEVHQKIEGSLSRERKDPSESRNMQIFSMAEDMISQGVISATMESSPSNTRLLQKPEIIFSQPSNQETQTKMISKGIQTPLNFFTFNLLYNQAVSKARMGDDAMTNDTSSKRNEFEKGIASTETIKNKPKKDLKIVQKNDTNKTKVAVSTVKSTNNSKDELVNKKEKITKENISSSLSAVQETSVKNSEILNNKNQPMNKEPHVILKTVDDATLKKSPNDGLSPRKGDLKVQTVKTNQIVASNEAAKGALKKTNKAFSLRPIGFRSRINRLIKAAKETVKVNCIVVGMVPFDDSIDIHKYGRITLNVVEASDYKICSKVKRFEGMVFDLTVKNTVLLAEVFKASTAEQLYEKMRNMFFCGNKVKEYEFLITKDNDGSFTWIQKAFVHEDLDAGSESIYPVKRGELPLPTSVMFKSLNPSSIGTFSTNVLLVGIRCKKAIGGAKYRLLVTDFSGCPSIREVNVRAITVLGEMQLSNVYEVFIGNDVIAESLINELQQTYGEKLNDFNFQFAIDNMYFKDLCLSHLGIVLSLKYSTKFYANSLDIRYLTSILLKYENGFAGSLEAMKQLKMLYENYDTKISKNILKGSMKSIQICMPYSYQDSGYVLFADRYSKEKQESIKRLVNKTLDRIKHTDKLSIYDKVVEISSLKDLLNNVHKTKVIIQLTNYQLLGAKYMSNGCIEFEVGVKGEKGSFKMYILPQSNISKMFSKKENTESTYPLVYNEIMKLKFPTSPKSPIFLSSFEMAFGDDDCLAQYWVMIGFSSIW